MKIIDNFLDEDYLKDIQETIINNQNLHWSLHKSSTDNDVGTNFFACYTNEDIFTDLYNQIINLTELENVGIMRWYINCNPSGENHSGDWHIDAGDGSNITALFYPMPWNSRMYGGETEFKTPEEVVEYKENRLVIFDGNRLHRAAPHNYKYMRFSIAFKLKARWNEDSINN